MVFWGAPTLAMAVDYVHHSYFLQTAFSTKSKTQQSIRFMATIHWPGGIPRGIKHYPKTDLSQEELREEVKGWILFVQESWVPRDQANVSDDDKEYELR
jgi:hypothetical protein